MSTKLADAKPDKSFFVESITKDITLLDCVLDLIDNAIDSASLELQPGDVLSKADCLKGFKVEIHFDKNGFKIYDNAKGISLDNAEHTVFRFGSPKVAQPNNESIGYYGIGLKRATFKLGKKIKVSSTTPTEKFDVDIDIPKWLADPLTWEFPINVTDDKGSYKETGVRIEVSDLYPDIVQAFEATSFKAKLMDTIGRDYYFFFKAGIEVTINGDPVPVAELEIKSDGDFQPGFMQYSEDGVEIKIVSGCHSKFEEQNNEDPENFDPKISGWYVICNNRIVLAANKDEKTVWKGKHENFSFWHNQYNGFVGFVFFNSSNPKKLPWTTSKRYVDLESNVYRAALPRMHELTKPWLSYTNQRKSNPEQAKAIESKAGAKTLLDLVSNTSTKKHVPAFPVIQAAAKVQESTIAYKVEKYKAEKAKTTLGNPSMSNGELGKHTFNYFYQNEIE